MSAPPAAPAWLKCMAGYWECPVIAAWRVAGGGRCHDDQRTKPVRIGRVPGEGRNCCQLIVCRFASSVVAGFACCAYFYFFANN